jgi:hypothetical protein
VDNESDSIFKWGGDKTDVGDSVTVTWKSTPLFALADWNTIISSIGIWRQSDDTGKLSIKFFNDQGTMKDSLVNDPDSTQYRFRLLQTNTGESNYWQVQISSKVDSLAVQRIDITARKASGQEKH